MRLPLKQLAAGAAATGQTVAFNAATGLWEPTSVSTGIGSWEFMQEAEVTGAPAQDLELTGLDGNADKFYRVALYVNHGDPPTSFKLTWEPNSAAGTGKGAGRQVNTSSVVQGFQLTDLALNNAITNENLTALMELDARTGANRVMTVQAAAFQDSMTNVGLEYSFHSIWQDDATNLTSLRFHASTTNGLGVGSRAAIWRSKAAAVGRNLSPASEELTGDTYNGSPVYRQHFTGTTATNGSVTLIGSGVDTIIIHGGHVLTTSSFKIPPGYSDGSSRCDVKVNPSNALLLQSSGSFNNTAYDIFVEYTKL